MMLVAMTIPDDPAQLASWLERQLAGLDLGRLVEELSIIHASPAAPPASLRQLLGDHVAAVTQQGLAGLPFATLRQLLRQPALLLELQEIVLSAGSPYWDRLAAAGASETMIERGWQRLRQTLPLDPPVEVRIRGRWLTYGLAFLSAAAAILLLAFLIYPLFLPPSPPAVVAWGWAKPGALPRGGSPAAYLRQLAAEADEWFSQPRDSKEALTSRIDELRQSCRVLLEADHEPLAPADRAWLKERCRDWLKKFDEASAALEAGEDVKATGAKVDATIRRLAAAMRERADKIESLEARRCPIQGQATIGTSCQT
jgi:hypothetical protein